mmetsp:Transcript_6542/g.18775  ORF Transcript_6542/g.18775 Transcript_6542/m.18775 type:complete len:108 (-) Transcript_6542:185-508(-)
MKVLRFDQYSNAESRRDACFTSYVTAGYFQNDETKFGCNGRARTTSSKIARGRSRVLQEPYDEADVEFETTFELATEKYDLLTAAAGASVVGGAGLLIASILLSTTI